MTGKRVASWIRGLAAPAGLAAALLLLAAPAPGAGDAHAEAGADAAEAPAEEAADPHLVWNAINLAILLGVLVYYGRKPIQRYFGERRREIAHDIDRSAELLADSESRLADWQGRVERLDAELDEIRRTARRRAEGERDQILEQARAGAERIRRDADAAIERELHRAKAQLRDEAVALTVELASELMREQVTEQDRERLAGEFIDRIDGAAARTGPAES